MKTRISILAFAAALASVALSDDTTWWYTPDGGWKNTVTVGLATGSGGSLGMFTFSADQSEATIYGALKAAIDASGETQSAKNAYALACRALAQAIHADAVNARQDEKIKTLGDTLETFLYADTAEFKDSGGDVVGSYERDSGAAATVNSIKAARRYIASGAPVDSGRGAVVTHTIKKDFFNDKNITLQTDSDGKSYALRGFSDLSDSAGDEELGGADRWALDYRGYYIPFATGASSNMGWARWNGWDANIFSAGHDISTGHINDQPLYLNGWYADDASCDTKFQNILTNAYSGTDRREHWILSRYKHGSANPVIHWIPFDEEALEVGKEPVADDKSVEYTQDENAQADDPKKFRLKGFDTAKPEQATDGAVLPFVDATSDDLQWGSIMDFFADSVFRQSSETGKILLNGTSEEGKVKILAMTGTGGDDQHIATLAFDNESIDGNPSVGGVVQLHAFATAPSPYASGDVSFADVLTNTSTQITGMSIPVRVPENGTTTGYAVKYVPMGKITGIPAAAVDDKTIEVNKEDPQNPYLQLYGAAGEGIELETGDVYMIGSDGKGKFGKGTGADGDDSEAESGFNSLESYSNTDGDRFLRLKGWDTSYETPHVVGKDGDMKYYEVNGGGGIETHTSVAGDQLQLSGYDTAANGALPYKVNDGNGISWLAGVDDRVPLLHTSGAPTTMAIGGSLDKANVSAVPTLNVSGFTAGGNCTAKLNTMLSDPNDGSNRSAHQFMARYSSGGGTPTVHWVSIDDVIGGGGSPVDDTSITTNASHGASSEGVASIFGFSTASAGDIPHKTDDGKIEWKPVASGGALIVSGTSGSTVTTATCTNKLSFVSASDSNVKFTVTDKGDGNVEVKIGVYYK